MKTVDAGAHIELSAVEARGVALAAQGIGLPRPNGRINVRHLRRAIDDIGLLQRESVNVLCRSHYLPLFSRFEDDGDDAGDLELVGFLPE